MYIIHSMNYSGSRSSDSPDDLAQNAADLALLTRDLAGCCQTKEAHIFGEFGLSPSEGNVLLAVAGDEGARPSKIAGRLGLTRSRLTPLTASLVHKGFLTRSESTEDRRIKRLALTARGRRVAELAHASRIEFHVRLLKRYPEPERERLLETLAALRSRMDAVRTDSASVSERT